MSTVLLLSPTMHRRDATTGPLGRVLTAVQDGARTAAEIAVAARLTPSMVTASLEHLSRTGRLRVMELTSGCPAGRCSSCALIDGCETQRR
ncbi:MAG: FeoC-like transcriptional regulator [Propionibacteriaceae bacterium]|nr:FeoC-like transcriptional regulator [Propionibacteriaceae bacterium]